MLRNTLFETKGFSYTLANSFIRPSIAFSFEILKATDEANYNRVVPSAFLLRTSHSSSFIATDCFAFRPTEGTYISGTNSPPFASSIIDNFGH